MKKFIILTIFLILGSFLVWKFFLDKPAKINTHTVSKKDIKETLSLSGEIVAKEDVTLRFQTSGYLTWIGVKEGDTVKKFQTIASLDQVELQKNLKKYLNTYMSERWDFETDKKNYETRITNDLKIILDKAQFDLNNSVIDVEVKDLAVKYANLWSPIEGLVVFAKTPLAGVNITPTQAEFQIVNPKTIYFSATADQTDVVNLSASQSGIITLDAFLDKPVTSKITSVAFTPKSGETGTVYEIKMTLPLDNSNYQYRLGMTGDAEFVTKEIPNVLAVPTKYVKTDKEGLKYVWLKDGQNKKKWIVTIGESLDNQIEIKSGLKEKDIIFEQ